MHAWEALTPERGVLRVFVVGPLECELQPFHSDHVQLPLLRQAAPLILDLLALATFLLEVRVIHLCRVFEVRSGQVRSCRVLEWMKCIAR